MVPRPTRPPSRPVSPGLIHSLLVQRGAEHPGLLRAPSAPCAISVHHSEMACTEAGWLIAPRPVLLSLPTLLLPLRRGG